MRLGKRRVWKNRDILSMTIGNSLGLGSNAQAYNNFNLFYSVLKLFILHDEMRLRGKVNRTTKCRPGFIFTYFCQADLVLFHNNPEDQ